MSHFGGHAKQIADVSMFRVVGASQCFLDTWNLIGGSSPIDSGVPKKKKSKKKEKNKKNEGYYLPYGASYNRCHLCWNHHFSYPRNLQVNR